MAVLFSVSTLCNACLNGKFPEILIVKALKTSDVIEDYSADMAEPGWLILGQQDKQPFHLVASRSSEKGVVTIITVYMPDPDRWEMDNRRRRR